jgi:hypothetical protein
VWLYGTSSGRWALSLSFAAPGMSLDSSILPGMLLHADLHFYPGTSCRVVVGEEHGDPADVGSLPVEDFDQARQRFAALLGSDPWATRLPALVAVAPVPPPRPGGRWRLRDRHGSCVDLVGLDGDPWPVLARSAGEPVELVGEWSEVGLRPLSLLPDRYGHAFSTTLVA